jgi:hypothetical protein
MKMSRLKQLRIWWDSDTSQKSIFDQILKSENKAQIIVGPSPSSFFESPSNPINTIASTPYNFASVGKNIFNPAETWNISETSSIPLVDIRIMVINNLIDAKKTFRLAEHVLNNMELYRLHERSDLQPNLSIAVSIANHIRKSPYGFFSITPNLFEPIRGTEVAPDVIWNPTAKSLTAVRDTRAMIG